MAAIDQDLMKVVLTNLLDNAVKASEPGGRIYLSCGPADSGGCEVEVRDEGRGIAEKDLPGYSSRSIPQGRPRPLLKLESGSGCRSAPGSSSCIKEPFIS
ncbi:ATP-binding protein [Paenibacillus sp. CC-CFT747]|nr:ATP-binding protein [Paenibacillus sp. CC-CFT747]